MADTPTIQIDQIADAIVAVPGTKITILDPNISTTHDLSNTETTWTNYDDDSSPQELRNTFNVPVAGDYLILFSMQAYGNGGSAAGYVRLVFDAGESYEQIVPSDDDKLLIADGNSSGGHRQNFSDAQFVTLTAGSHTINVQGKWSGGSGSALRMDGSSYCNVRGILVSGSGAGGVLVAASTTGENSITGVYSPSLSPTEVSALQQTITCTAGDRLDINFLGRARLNTYSAGAWAAAYLKIDDVYIEIDSGSPFPEAIMSGRFTENSFPVNLSFRYISDALSAGTHTIKFFFSKWSSADDTWLLRSAQSSVSIYRGGLVPIKNNGTVVQDTPRDVDYGAAFSVSDSAGSVSIKSTSLWRYFTATDLPTGAAAPEAVWKGDSLSDQTANSHNLTEVGTAKYGAAEGLKGWLCEDNLRLNIASPSGLVSAGAFTFSCLVSLHRDSGESDLIVVGGDGSTAANNSTVFCYLSTYTFRSFAEYGVGSNIQVDFDAGPLFGPVHHVTFTRSSDGLTYKVYVDGALVDTKVVANAPNDGSSGVAALLGSQTYSTTNFHGLFLTGLHTKEEWSAAQVLEHYQWARRLV